MNKSWKQHPTKWQLYSYLHTISQTIHVRWTIHVGHCWRSGQTLKWYSPMDSSTWTHQCWLTCKTHHKLCADTGCYLEHLLMVMTYRDWWSESESGESVLSSWLDMISSGYFYLVIIIWYLSHMFQLNNNNNNHTPWKTIITSNNCS